MNLDDLFRFGDVEPAPIGLPALSDDLHQSSSERGIGNVRNAFAVGLHVQFQLFVFLDDVLFDVLQVNAGILDGRILVAAGDFDSNASLWIGLLNFVGRLGLRRGRILRHSRPCKQYCQGEAEQANRLRAKSHGYLSSILYGMTWLGQVSPSAEFDAILASRAAQPLPR